MKKSLYFSLFFAQVFLLVGCAAMLVPVKFDPQAKLRWAEELNTKQNRPLPAERLIQEAVDIYQNKHDQLGLAEAYRQYAFFFRSETVGRWSKYYRDNGFLDKSATFDTRYTISILYFEKARDIFLVNKRYDALANVYLNMAFTYELMSDKKAACSAFDLSLLSNDEHVKMDPHAKINLPQGYSSFEEFITYSKKQDGCI